METASTLEGSDNQDDDFIIDPSPTRVSLMDHYLAKIPEPLITREFVTVTQNLTTDNEVTSDFRILSWNILAQSLAINPDSFTAVQEGTFDWRVRRLRILYKILFYDPDIICLQEVDHFKFLNANLSSLGYTGFFQPKPNSPCLKTPGNNGPDGCALFFRNQTFELIKSSRRILQTSEGTQSNQVCILAHLRVVKSGKEICVVTTHLKATKGFETLRNLQGEDLVQFLISSNMADKPLILCGDFNAVPTEPVLATLKEGLTVTSAYTKLYGGQEPPYTRWKIRGGHECKSTIDYILHNKHCQVKRVLPVPDEDLIRHKLPPNLSYPSDHIALACDFKITV